MFFQEVETDQEISDWEKYAAEEYDILVAEEAANEQCNDVCLVDISVIQSLDLSYHIFKRASWLH